MKKCVYVLCHILVHLLRNLMGLDHAVAQGKLDVHITLRIHVIKLTVEPPTPPCSELHSRTRTTA